MNATIFSLLAFIGAIFLLLLCWRRILAWTITTIAQSRKIQISIETAGLSSAAGIKLHLPKGPVKHVAISSLYVGKKRIATDDNDVNESTSPHPGFLQSLLSGYPCIPVCISGVHIILRNNNNNNNNGSGEIQQQQGNYDDNNNNNNRVVETPAALSSSSSILAPTASGDGGGIDKPNDSIEASSSSSSSKASPSLLKWRALTAMMVQMLPITCNNVLILQEGGDDGNKASVGTTTTTNATIKLPPPILVLSIQQLGVDLRKARKQEVTISGVGIHTLTSQKMSLEDMTMFIKATNNDLGSGTSTCCSCTTTGTTTTSQQEQQPTSPSNIKTATTTTAIPSTLASLYSLLPNPDMSIHSLKVCHEYDNRFTLLQPRPTELLSQLQRLYVDIGIVKGHVNVDMVLQSSLVQGLINKKKKSSSRRRETDEGEQKKSDGRSAGIDAAASKHENLMCLLPLSTEIKLPSGCDVGISTGGGGSDGNKKSKLMARLQLANYSTILKSNARHYYLTKSNTKTSSKIDEEYQLLTCTTSFSHLQTTVAVEGGEEASDGSGGISSSKLRSSKQQQQQQEHLPTAAAASLFEIVGGNLEASIFPRQAQQLSIGLNVEIESPSVKSDIDRLALVVKEALGLRMVRAKPAAPVIHEKSSNVGINTNDQRKMPAIICDWSCNIKATNHAEIEVSETEHVMCLGSLDTLRLAAKGSNCSCITSMNADVTDLVIKASSVSSSSVLGPVVKLQAIQLQVEQDDNHTDDRCSSSREHSPTSPPCHITHNSYKADVSLGTCHLVSDAGPLLTLTQLMNRGLLLGKKKQSSVAANKVKKKKVMGSKKLALLLSTCSFSCGKTLLMCPTAMHIDNNNDKKDGDGLITAVVHAAISCCWSSLSGKVDLKKRQAQLDCDSLKVSYIEGWKKDDNNGGDGRNNQRCSSSSSSSIITEPLLDGILTSCLSNEEGSSNGGNGFSIGHCVVCPSLSLDSKQHVKVTGLKVLADVDAIIAFQSALDSLKQLAVDAKNDGSISNREDTDDDDDMAPSQTSAPIITQQHDNESELDAVDVVETSQLQQQQQHNTTTSTVIPKDPPFTISLEECTCYFPLSPDASILNTQTISDIEQHCETFSFNMPSCQVKINTNHNDNDNDNDSQHQKQIMFFLPSSALALGGKPLIQWTSVHATLHLLSSCSKNKFIQLKPLHDLNAACHGTTATITGNKNSDAKPADWAISTTTPREGDTTTSAAAPTTTTTTTGGPSPYHPQHRRTCTFSSTGTFDNSNSSSGYEPYTRAGLASWVDHDAPDAQGTGDYNGKGPASMTDVSIVGLRVVLPYDREPGRCHRLAELMVRAVKEISGSKVVGTTESTSSIKTTKLKANSGGGGSIFPMQLNLSLDKASLRFEHQPLEAWLAGHAPLLRGMALQRHLWEDIVHSVPTADETTSPLHAGVISAAMLEEHLEAGEAEKGQWEALERGFFKQYRQKVLEGRRKREQQSSAAVSGSVASKVDTDLFYVAVKSIKALVVLGSPMKANANSTSDEKPHVDPVLEHIEAVDPPSKGITMSAARLIHIDLSLSGLEVKACGGNTASTSSSAPFPLVASPHTHIFGTTAIARQAVAPAATVFNRPVVVGKHRRVVLLSVAAKGTKAPWKLYTDIQLTGTKLAVAYSQGQEPVFALVAMAGKRLVASDSSFLDSAAFAQANSSTSSGGGTTNNSKNIKPTPMPWWDELRYLWRGITQVNLQGFEFHLGATHADAVCPSQQRFQIQSAGLAASLESGDWALDMHEAGLTVFVSAGLQQLGGTLLAFPCLQAPSIRLGVQCEWKLPGGRKDSMHHLFPAVVIDGQYQQQESIAVGEVYKAQGLNVSLQVLIADDDMYQNNQNQKDNSAAAAGGGGGGVQQTQLPLRTAIGYIGDKQVEFWRTFVHNMKSPPKHIKSIGRRGTFFIRKPRPSSGSGTDITSGKLLVKKSLLKLLEEMHVSVTAAPLEVVHATIVTEDPSDGVCISASQAQFSARFLFNQPIGSFLKMPPYARGKRPLSAGTRTLTEQLQVRAHDVRGYRGGAVGTFTPSSSDNGSGSVGGPPPPSPSPSPSPQPQPYCKGGFDGDGSGNDGSDQQGGRRISGSVVQRRRSSTLGLESSLSEDWGHLGPTGSDSVSRKSTLLQKLVHQQPCGSKEQQRTTFLNASSLIVIREEDLSGLPSGSGHGGDDGGGEGGGGGDGLDPSAASKGRPLKVLVSDCKLLVDLETRNAVWGTVAHLISAFSRRTKEGVMPPSGAASLVTGLTPTPTGGGGARRTPSKYGIGGNGGGLRSRTASVEPSAGLGNGDGSSNELLQLLLQQTEEGDGDIVVEAGDGGREKTAGGLVVINGEVVDTAQEADNNNDNDDDDDDMLMTTPLDDMSSILKYDVEVVNLQINLEAPDSQGRLLLAARSGSLRGLIQPEAALTITTLHLERVEAYVAQLDVDPNASVIWLQTNNNNNYVGDGDKNKNEQQQEARIFVEPLPGAHATPFHRIFNPITIDLRHSKASGSAMARSKAQSMSSRSFMMSPVDGSGGSIFKSGTTPTGGTTTGTGGGVASSSSSSSMAIPSTTGGGGISHHYTNTNNTIAGTSPFVSLATVPSPTCWVSPTQHAAQSSSRGEELVLRVPAIAGTMDSREFEVLVDVVGVMLGQGPSINTASSEAALIEEELAWQEGTEEVEEQRQIHMLLKKQLTGLRAGALEVRQLFGLEMVTTSTAFINSATDNGGGGSGRVTPQHSFGASTPTTTAYGGMLMASSSGGGGGGGQGRVGLASEYQFFVAGSAASEAAASLLAPLLANAPHKLPSNITPRTTAVTGVTGAGVGATTPLSSPLQLLQEQQQQHHAATPESPSSSLYYHRQQSNVEHYASTIFPTSSIQTPLQTMLREHLTHLCIGGGTGTGTGKDEAGGGTGCCDNERRKDSSGMNENGMMMVPGDSSQVRRMTNMQQALLLRWIEEQENGAEDAYENSRAILTEFKNEMRKRQHAKGASRVLLQVDRIVWQLCLRSREPFVQASLRTFKLDLSRNKDHSGSAKLIIYRIEVIDAQGELPAAPGIAAGVILSVWNPDKSWERDDAVRVVATMGPSTKNLLVFEHIDGTLHPFAVHLTESIAGKFWEYFFPKEDNKSTKRQEAFALSVPGAASKGASGRGRLSAAAAASRAQQQQQQMVASAAADADEHGGSGGTTPTIRGGGGIGSLPPSGAQSPTKDEGGASSPMAVLGGRAYFGSTSNTGPQGGASTPKAGTTVDNNNSNNSFIFSQQGGGEESVAAAVAAGLARPSPSSHHLRASTTTTHQQQHRLTAAAGGGGGASSSGGGQKLKRFSYVKFNRAHVRLTYEGYPLTFTDLKLVLDNRTYQGFDGRWRDLFAKIKPDVIKSVLKSVAGLQGRKLKELLPSWAPGFGSNNSGSSGAVGGGGIDGGSGSGIRLTGGGGVPSPLSSLSFAGGGGGPYDERGGRGGGLLASLKETFAGSRRKDELSDGHGAGGGGGHMTEEEMVAEHKKRMLMGDKYMAGGRKFGGGGGGGGGVASPPPPAVVPPRVVGSSPRQQQRSPGQSPMKKESSVDMESDEEAFSPLARGAGQGQGLSPKAGDDDGK